MLHACCRWGALAHEERQVTVVFGDGRTNNNAGKLVMLRRDVAPAVPGFLSGCLSLLPSQHHCHGCVLLRSLLMLVEAPDRSVTHTAKPDNSSSSACQRGCY